MPIVFSPSGIWRLHGIEGFGIVLFILNMKIAWDIGILYSVHHLRSRFSLGHPHLQYPIINPDSKSFFFFLAYPESEFFIEDRKFTIFVCVLNQDALIYLRKSMVDTESRYSLI